LPSLDCTAGSTSSIAFNDRSTNSGLCAGELLPAVHIGSKSLVVNTHALYSSPAFTVTFGNVATYSIMPEPAAGFVVEGVEVVRSQDVRSRSVSRNLTFDASPLFVVTIATTSPFDLSAPNIVIITLKMSVPFPVSACAGWLEKSIVVRIAPISKKMVFLSLMCIKTRIHRRVCTSMAK